MGFILPFGRKGKIRKLMGKYISNRIKEKMTFNQQIELLKSQLDDKQIDQHTYERLMDTLEIQYYQKQQEQWASVENKFQHPLNFQT